jgi:putative transposase
MITLDLEKLANDTELVPYWNEQCLAIQSDLPVPVGNPEQTSLWQETYPTGINIPTFMLANAPTVKADVEKACKKIRVYPSNPEKIDNQIHACRRAYNLCIAKYREWAKGDKPVDRTELRSRVREQVKQEALDRGVETGTTHLDEACREAWRANQAVIRNRIRGRRSELRFRKRTATKQGFIYQKLSRLGIPHRLGVVHLTEGIPNEAIGKQARFVREHGRYFLIVKRFIATAAAKIQGNTVGIDPGVRTFVTTYAPEQATKFGAGFAWNRLRPLGIQLDKLYSKRKKLFNRWGSLPNQLREDLLRGFENRINRLKQRRNDLIEDFQKRVCYWLVTNYDIIFLPSFKTQQMSQRGKRKIGSKTVRAMMGLCHYKFKLRLAWMCRKYGKRLIEVNEAYTTQTQSWDGKRQHVDQANVISDGTITMDRDINGARGIFLRAITR